jgi:hypothetical protein
VIRQDGTRIDFQTPHDAVAAAKAAFELSGVWPVVMAIFKAGNEQAEADDRIALPLRLLPQ